MLAAAATAPRDSRAAKAVLVVQVADARTNGFIADAQVRIPTIGRIARTRWDGEVQFDNLDNGKYRIEVRAIGYEPGNVDVALIGDTLPVFFSLDRLSTTLDTVRVRAERVSRNLREFEERRRHKLGRFFTDSALMDNRATGLKWMLAMQIPGLRVSGNGVVSGETGGIPCSVAFWVDGFLVTPMPDGPIGSKGLADVRQKQVLDLEPLRLEEFAGMEVYSSVETPPQYRPSGMFCKVVLLWTKW
jgi:hypothetical protein